LFGPSFPTRRSSDPHATVTRQYTLAKELLTTKADALQRLARALFEREVLSAVEVATVIEGRPLPPIRARNSAPVPASEPSRKPAPVPPGGLVAEPS
jgi:cell division protease FtsH